MNIKDSIRLKVMHEISKRMSLASVLYLLSLRRTKAPFNFNGQRLDYLFHSYNNLGLTERSVEIPIVKHYLTSRKWSNVLEIGNVTNYYEDYFAGLFPNKTVVDKIERNHNVITTDVAKFSSPVAFDFIFSISTFEHMDSDLGRNVDHRPGTATHGSAAADNIVHCYEDLLAPGGLMVITAPLGYTPEWDETFKSDMLDRYPFAALRKIVVNRVSEQEWGPVSALEPGRKYEYGRPFPYANHVSILEIAK